MARRAAGGNPFEQPPFGSARAVRAGGGAGRRRSAPARGRDHHARIDIDLEEAFRGGNRTFELKRPQVDSEGLPADAQAHCEGDHSSPGITQGQQLRLAGQGEESAQGGEPGDLFLEVHIRPHNDYEIDGRECDDHLRRCAPWEAALGATVPVPTLGGEVEMRIPAGAQSGQKLRLRGRGLPGNPAGDQFVQLKVVLAPGGFAAERVSSTSR